MILIEKKSARASTLEIGTLSLNEFPPVILTLRRTLWPQLSGTYDNELL